MKVTNKTNMWGVLVAVSFTASYALAQGTIADDELLKMLDASDAAAVAAEVEPVEPEVAPVEVEAVEEPSEEAVAAEEIPAEETPAEEAVAEEATEEVAAEEGEVDDLGMTTYDEDEAAASGELISVRLSKVGLEEAINLFAQLSGANIIVPELTEAAQISVNLKDVEWRPALQSILDSYNYELYQKVSGSNVYSVRRRPVGAPEPQVVETFHLRYATVPNAAELVRTLLPEDAKVSEFASRNMIVVKSSESSLSEIRSVLATIDTVRQQVFIESKFMELNDQAQKDLGIDWQMLQSYQAGASTLSSSLEKIDNESTTTSRLFDMAGVELPGVNGAPEYIDDMQGGFERYQETLPTTTEVTESAVNQYSTAVLDADDFSVILSALEENKGVNVVSNPKIIVANEEQANISIIRKEPNLRQERQQALNDQPDTITYTLDPDRPFFDYGIKLDVIPSINTASNITVNIKPSLTRKFGDKLAGENSYPIIDEKTIETVFNLNDGQTAAIGGLTEVEDSEIQRKIPVLGSIPFIGRLFRWDQTIHAQKETVIFVTVGLANNLNIDAQSGLPEDAELSRRRYIRDRNAKALRAQGRKHYEAEEDDKLDDMMNDIDRKEEKRVEKRAKKTEVASN